jgi:GMP synthase PP-ATPase subunit
MTEIPKVRLVTSLAWDLPLPSGAFLRVHYSGEVTEADVNFVRRAMEIITGTIELARTDDEGPLLPCQREIFNIDRIAK